MHDSNHTAPIFRSEAPEAFARASVLLKVAQIPFRALDTNEGSWRFPRHMHHLLVSESNEEKALQAIAKIPSEVIPPLSRTAEITPEERSRARFALGIFLLIILFYIILFVLRS